MIRHPKWLRVKLPAGEEYFELKSKLKSLNLNTVCESARCPNVAECWKHRHATVMILGDICTRNCKFCAVKTGNPRGYIDKDEPYHVAEAVKYMNLRYVVITSVDRDDLEDGGAKQFYLTITEIKKVNPGIKVEALIPDFRGSEALIDLILESQVDVISHNLETVRRLTPTVRDRRASFETSLAVLRYIKRRDPNRITKSGFMMGLGETFDEAVETLRDLRSVLCDIVTIGQYLQPTKQNIPVKEYISPEVFASIKEIGMSMGFLNVESAPLVRSSFHSVLGL
jgi:lipoic acid synthetase